MIYRILTFSIGLILAACGASFLILYSAYLQLGFSFGNYLALVFTRFETYFLPIGLALMAAALFCDRFWRWLRRITKGRRLSSPGREHRRR